MGLRTERNKILRAKEGVWGMKYSRRKAAGNAASVQGNQRREKEALRRKARRKIARESRRGNRA